MEKLVSSETQLNTPLIAELEKQQGFVDKLRERDFVDEYIPYEDPKGFNHRSLDTMPDEVKDDVRMLLRFVNAPILKDAIEEQYTETGEIIKGARSHIHTFTQSEGLEMQDFYNSNKLEASNISNALFVSSWMKEKNLLSPKTIEELERVRSAFAPKDSIDDYSIGQYYSFSREKKYAFEKEVTTLLEDVLTDVFAHYES